MKSALSIVILVLVLFSCNTKEEISKKEVVENYANIVYANYLDAHEHAWTLREEVKRFTKTHTQAGFEKTKKEWL